MTQEPVLCAALLPLRLHLSGMMFLFFLMLLAIIPWEMSGLWWVDTVAAFVRSQDYTTKPGKYLCNTRELLMRGQLSGAVSVVVMLLKAREIPPGRVSEGGWRHGWRTLPALPGRGNSFNKHLFPLPFSLWSLDYVKWSYSEIKEVLFLAMLGERELQASL